MICEHCEKLFTGKLNELLDLENNVVLVCDECYLEWTFGGSQFVDDDQGELPYGWLQDDE